MKSDSITLKSIDLSQSMPAALAWTLTLNANVIAKGKPLSVCQAADAVEVGVKNPEAVRILRLPSLPEPDSPQLRLVAKEVGLDLPWLAARSLDAATSGPRSRLAARRASHSRRGDEEEAEADADADAEAALLLL